MQVKLTLLLLDVAVRLVGVLQPLVGSQVGGGPDLGDLMLLHLSFGEALLHTRADEVAAVVGDTVEDLDQS